MIKFINLYKKFGSFIAVDNLNLEIPPGQCFGFLGPNGAGKTTTIKMMTGLYTPSEGRIILGGYDVVINPIEAKSIIGYIPDQPYIYDKLTGREYLYFCAGLYKIDGTKIDTSIDEMIKYFELDMWIDRRMETYSQGMAQRLIFASALIHSPKIIIIDEPMVGLDPRSASLVKNILRERCSNGATIFMSTHILNFAEELCDRIAIINRGKIIFDEYLNGQMSLEKRFGQKLEKLFLKLTD